MTRRNVREAIFMMLFQTEFHADISTEDTLRLYMTLDQDTPNEEEEEEQPIKLSSADAKYIQDVLDGVAAHKAEIDAVISRLSKGWTIDRLMKVDVAILRYCLFELMYLQPNIPSSVSINEAVEIAKKYGSDKSKAFVNGVLSSFYKELSGGEASQ